MSTTMAPPGAKGSRCDFVLLDTALRSFGALSAVEEEIDIPLKRQDHHVVTCLITGWWAPQKA
eukprot:9060408-Prorocentrum_lima.AAC.1